MNREFDDSAKIEAYLRNDLSPAEKAEFEERISRDPLLQNELTLQQDIIASLQDFRKAELKARLNRIDLTEGQATGMNLFLYLKATGLLVFVAMLGYGGMWLLNRPESSKPAVVETPADKPVANPTPSKPQSQSNLADSQSLPDNQALDTPAKPVAPADKLTDETDKSLQPSLKSPRTVRPDRNAAEPTGSKAIRPENRSEDKQHETSGSLTKRAEDISEGKSSNTTDKGTSEVKRENEPAIGGRISSGSNKAPNGLNINYPNSPYKFHYTNNGHLSLHGDFTKGYKIVRLEDREYLDFDGNFYFIEPNQVKITPLIKVTDEELITKLRKLDEQE